MTAKEYYNSTRMVETRHWTLEMTLAFAEEYHKFGFQSKEPNYAVEGDYCAVCGCTEFWNNEEEE